MRVPFSFHPDIPFAGDDANRFLPWIVALMVCLTALMLLIGLSLNQSLTQRHASFSQAVTVQVPNEVASEAVLAQVREAIENTKGFGAARTASLTEVQGMVSPWIGDDAMMEHLPLPAVLHVSTAPGAKADAEALAARLRDIDPRIAVDTHALWAEKFSRFAQAVQMALYTLAGFILATLAAMVVFTAREAMKLHRRTVLLLHAIGADDGYIARQFQTNAARITLLGALIGTAAAAAVFASGGWYIRLLDAPLLPQFSVSTAHGFALVMLPLLSSLLAMLSARCAVLRQLKLLP